MALERKNSLLISDDFKARKIAEKLYLEYTGSLGIFLHAKLTGIIPSIKPILHKIKSTNFHISEKVIEELFKEAGEI